MIKMLGLITEVGGGFVGSNDIRATMTLYSDQNTKLADIHIVGQGLKVGQQFDVAVTPKE